MAFVQTKIQPIILAGGEGVRLWPLSTPQMPKQFIPLLGAQSLFQKTLARMALIPDALPPIIVTLQKYKKIVQSQTKQLGIQACFIFEPCSKNTALAITIATLWAKKINPKSIVLILPCDHLIRQEKAFIQSIQNALSNSLKNTLCLFGVKPSAPLCGYGYIEVEEGHVKRFIEKPDLEQAKLFLASSCYFWNAGIFLFKPDVFLYEMQLHSPFQYQLSNEIYNALPPKRHIWIISNQFYHLAPAISIDKALFEKTTNRVLTPLKSDFIDLGTWQSVFSLLSKDENQNVTQGLVATQNVTHSLIFNKDNKPLIIAGAENMLIVVTKNGVLVTHLDEQIDIKLMLDTNFKINNTNN